jgi:hypothetical protein
MYDEQNAREHEIAPELAALEQQLRGMTPAAPRVDRDRLMFAAGQATGAASIAEPSQDGRAMYDRAGRPLYVAGPSWTRRRFWPVATFTMTAATFLLATMLVWQNRPQPIAKQTAPTSAAVVSEGGSHDVDADVPTRFAVRNSWPSIPSINSGYLGVRYVALTRGIGALSPDVPSSTGDQDLPSSSRAKPNTPRSLLEELAPPTRTPNSSRS